MSEIGRLGRELVEAGQVKIPAGLVKDFRSVGRDFERAWARNARRTAGDVGKHYPDSITSEVTGAGGVVQVDVGPEAGLPQGGMGRGFEFAVGRQTRPHLNGLRAMPAAEKKLSARTAKTIDRNIPGGAG